MSVRTIHQKSVSIILLILVLSVTPYFLIDKSECQSYPQKATYVLTLHPEKNEADIIYTIMVNNSQRSYADFTLNYDYFEEREIVDSKITMFPIMKGRMLDEASHNITVVPYENASRVKGTITFSLEGYSSAFFSLRYTIKDVFRTIEYKDDPEYHSLDFSVLLDSKDVTFAVRVPKHVEFFQTDALNFFAIEPSPSIEIEDGEFIKLVWNVPPQQLEGRFSQFNPAIIFNYKINSIFLIRQVLLTFILIFVAFIVERLLLVKIWPSVKGRVSPKSNKQISYQPLIPPVSSFSKKALLKEYEESRQMHNYYGKIIWEVLSIFFWRRFSIFWSGYIPD